VPRGLRDLCSSLVLAHRWAYLYLSPVPDLSTTSQRNKEEASIFFNTILPTALSWTHSCL